jgi:anti-sigma factor RsiW
MDSAADHDGHVRLLLGAHVLGGLNASQEAVVRAHLAGCARCRAERDWLAVVPSWLDLLAQETPAEDWRELPDGPLWQAGLA